MSEQQPPGPFDGVAQKWRRLAERRRAHFIDLAESGRWKRYYSEEQFLHHLREAFQASERWAMIAPPPVAETPAVVDEIATVTDETATGIDERRTDIPRRSAA